MRIIHTGDWHLNHRLGRADLTVPLQQAVQQVACHLEEKQADVLLIAGDLFMGRESRDQLRASLRFLKHTFEPFLKRNGTIIVLYGNHDNENFFLTLQDFGDMVSFVNPDDGIHAPGRVYVAPKPDILKLRDKSGQIVQFVLLPYPIPTAYMPTGDNLPNDPDQRLAAMTDCYRNTLREMCDKVDTKYPAVLVGHITVRGTAAADLFRPQSREVMLEINDLPAHFAYGAFGHIHRPGVVSQGLDHFRYCGSLLPLDAGEAGQAKSVTLVEIGKAGRVGAPVSLPINGQHLRKIVIDAEEVGNLAEKYAVCDPACKDGQCHKTAWVRYTLRYQVAAHPDPYPLHRKIQDFFPNWYDNDIEPIHPTDGGDPPDDGDELKHDIAENIRIYLKTLADFSGRDANQNEVVALVDALVAQEDLIKVIQSPETTEKSVQSNSGLRQKLMTVRIKEANE